MSADSADHADCPERRRLGAGETARVIHSQRSGGCPLDRCPVRGRLALFGSASAWAGTAATVTARMPIRCTTAHPGCRGCQAVLQCALTEAGMRQHRRVTPRHPSNDSRDGGRPRPREVRFELPGCRSDEGGMPVKGCRLGGDEAACAQSGLLADGKGQPFVLCEVGEVLDVEGGKREIIDKAAGGAIQVSFCGRGRPRRCARAWSWPHFSATASS